MAIAAQAGERHCTSGLSPKQPMLHKLRPGRRARSAGRRRQRREAAAAERARLADGAAPGARRAAPVDRTARVAAAVSFGRARGGRWTRCGQPQSAAGPSRAALEMLCAERARELALEAALCAAVGTPRRRGARTRALRTGPTARCAQEASRACAHVARGSRTQVDRRGAIASDDPDPRSLLSRLRAEVGRLRLPFAVVVQPALAPLAATGRPRRSSWRPAGRRPREDVARTVLHEIEGHALPRARAQRGVARCSCASARRGASTTRRGARCCSRSARRLLCDRRRRRMLAARHRAVEAMRRRRHVRRRARDAARARSRRSSRADAVVLRRARLPRRRRRRTRASGRERVYLESLVRVRAHLARTPTTRRCSQAGQVGARRHRRACARSCRNSATSGKADVL